MTQEPRRTIAVPLYWLAVTMLSIAAMLVASVVISIALADRNARQLVDRYERDKQVTAESNRQLYCALFGSQADAFADATTKAGKASFKAWLDLYRLANCEPVRR